MLGKGLESLIPQKKSGGSIPHTIHDHNEQFSQISQNIVKQYPRNSSGTENNNQHSVHHAPRHDEAIFQIEIEKIKPNPYQPRREFHEGDLEELAQSIREFGVLQPIVVTKIVKETEHGTEVEYQLIAGERRLMASKIIGLERIPAIIRVIDSQRVKLELALIENIQRSQLSAIDLAKAYARLQDEFNLTQREIAQRVGKSREVVANTLRLLNLPPEIQDALAARRINESHARMLLSFTNPLDQSRAFQDILVGKTHSRVRQENSSVQQKSEESVHEERYWERHIEEKLGFPVKVTKHGAQGRLVMQFYSEEEWRGILEKLLGQVRE